MGKPREMTGMDKMCWYGMCIGAFMTAAACVPMLPWNMAELYAGFHQRWPTKRMASPLMVTTQLGQYKPWSALQKIVCAMDREFQMPNILNAVVGLASGAIGAGGAAVGCPNWQACKDHVRQRCYAYQMLSIGGMMVVALYTCSLIAVICAMMGMCNEFGEKKARKIKKAAESVASTLSIGFGLNIFAYLIYVGITNMAYGDLKSNSAFPYPAASVGFGVGLFAWFMLLIAMFAGFQRKNKSDDDDDKEEEPQENYATEGKGGGGDDPPPASNQDPLLM